MKTNPWKGGSTRKWRELRRAVLVRDGARCRLKLDGCTRIATCVHHIDGKRLGDDPSRLQAACQNCNLAIGEPGREDPEPGRTGTAWGF